LAIDKARNTTTKQLTLSIWLQSMAEATLNAIKEHGVIVGLVVGAAAVAMIGAMMAGTSAINN
jgi:hypothetical protein